MSRRPPKCVTEATQLAWGHLLRDMSRQHLVALNHLTTQELRRRNQHAKAKRAWPDNTAPTEATP